MFKIICPFCGGTCKTVGGEDGDPFGRNRKEDTVCTACGRTVSVSAPIPIPQDVLDEMMTDADILDAPIKTVLRISATAEGAGVKRSAETAVPCENGTYPLKGDYPFGRFDNDRKPPFRLDGVTVKDDKIFIAGETLSIIDLPQTVTVKLTAYGYGYVPWEETLSVTVGIERAE